MKYNLNSFSIVKGLDKIYVYVFFFQNVVTSRQHSHDIVGVPFVITTLMRIIKMAAYQQMHVGCDVLTLELTVNHLSLNLEGVS